MEQTAPPYFVALVFKRQTLHRTAMHAMLMEKP